MNSSKPSYYKMVIFKNLASCLQWHIGWTSGERGLGPKLVCAAVHVTAPPVPYCATFQKEALSSVEIEYFCLELSVESSDLREKSTRTINTFGLWDQTFWNVAEV